MADVLLNALDIVSIHKGAWEPQKYLFLESWTGDKAVSPEVQLAALVEVIASCIQIVTDEDPQRMDGVIRWVHQRLGEECHYTLTLLPKDTPPAPPRPNNVMPLKPETDEPT